MNKLSQFLTVFTEVTASFLNIILGIGAVIIIASVVITELMKFFNPNIETTEQAIKHIATKIKQPKKEEEIEEEEDSGFVMPHPYVFFMLMPMIGVFFIIAVLKPLFPIFTGVLLDTVIKYYVLVLPYFAIFVALYMLGETGTRIFIWLARKTCELATSTLKIIKEKTENDEVDQE